MTPDRLAHILDDLLEAYRARQVYKFLHLPVQSGHDDILRAMGRRYTSRDYMELVSRFRDRFRDLTLSTDIIVGFPGEGEEEFQASVELLRKLRPDMLNITRFSPRPGTAAWSMGPKIRGSVVKTRSRLLTSIQQEMGLERNRHWMGRRVSVLAVERGKGRSTLCRTDEYRPVVVRESLMLGRWYDITVIDATPHYLLGKQTLG